MTYKEYQWKSIRQNILYGIIGMVVINPITILIISIIIGFTYSVWMALAYLAITLFYLRPALEDRIINDKEKNELFRYKLNHTVDDFSRKRISIETCLPAASFFEAQCINSSAQLLLKRKHVKYIQMIILSYMLVINDSYERSSISILDYIKEQDLNNQIFKPKLEKRSYEIIKEMQNYNYADKLTEYVTSLIIDYIADKTLVNKDIRNHIYKSLEKFGNGFSNAVTKRNSFA